MSTPLTDPVSAYIKANWQNCVRNGGGRANVVDIPRVHTVGSPSGNFNVLFYWDTYFVNLGLIASDRLDLAKANCEAFFWLIDQKGFVPNSAFVGDDNRSQPPFLSEMVADVYRAARDKAWLESAFPRLEREHAFWLKSRSFPNGLAHFGHDATREYLLSFYRQALLPRLKLDPNLDDESAISIGDAMLAEAESGQDFTPIYCHHTAQFADVELNTLLYLLERNLAWFAHELRKASEVERLWTERAERRAELVRTELWDAASGLFRPRSNVSGKFARIAHLGTFYPVWAGIATPEQTGKVQANLSRFERGFGLAQTEPYNGSKYQWAYPNGWPPSQWIAAKGLYSSGHEADAKRIARKYCDLQSNFLETYGNLWEKFDVVTGKPSQGEYPADPMLGWTAGVYLMMKQLIDDVA